ncbi:unnamed protein product, partial [Tenebrio molitor]
MRLISCRGVYVGRCKPSCLSSAALSTRNYVIGPFELPHRLNGNGYYEFLTRDLPGLLEEVPQQLRRDIWFMHD